MRDIAITALILGSLPFILRRPWLGALMFAWLSLMTPYRFAFGFAYDFPFVQIVAIVTLVSVLLHADQWKYELNPTLVLLWLLPLWTCVTTLFAFEPEPAAERLVNLLKTFLFVHVCAMVLRTREQVHWLLWVVVLSIGFFGAKGGAFTLLTAGEHRVYGPPGRSHLSDNNAIAVALIMVMPLMYYLRGEAESRWVRHGLLATMLLSAMAIVGTYSRGGMVAITAMLLFLWLKSQHKLMLAIVFAALVPFALAFMPDRWMDRMESVSEYESDGSAMGRINSWMTAINIAADRPIVGGGFALYTRKTFARYAPDPEDIHSAHSIYFQMLGEHGYVGLILFLALGLSAWLAARRTIILARERADLAWATRLARALQVTLVGYAVGGLFVNISYWDLYYYIVLIAALTLGQVSKQTRLPTSTQTVETPRAVAGGASG
jgi:putative inorganic carbon (hco3(-)) transporter